MRLSTRHRVGFALRANSVRAGFILVCGALLALGCRRATNEPAAAKSSATPAAEATPFAIAKSTKWKTVEEFDYTGNPSLSQVHFKLELPEGYDDPGDFLRIRIRVKDLPELVVDNSDGWIEYNSHDQPSEVYARLKDRNLVQSQHVLVIPFSNHKGEPPLIFLRSWGYASNAERLHVIGFRKTGQPTLLFNDEFDLIELGDLDGDGYSEIVGRPCLGEGLGEDFVTYTPIQVYKVPHPITGPARLSVSLSKRYNLQHSYGWAGQECSESTFVVLHPPGGGKPMILPEGEARKLMEHRKK